MSPAGDRRTLTLLINPASGRGRARRKLPWVVSELGRLVPDADVVVRISTDFADAQVGARRAVDEARPGDALLVMGGDGMASIGLNAAASSGVPLGVLPAGTGNDFVRGVGLPGKLPDALKVVAAGHTSTVDLMSVDGELIDGTQRRWVGSVLSTGFDEKVNWRTNHLPFNVGAPSYAYSVFAELRTFRPLQYRIEVDGSPRDLKAILVAVGNAGVFGGGIRICPDARVDDGLLDITIVHPVSRALVFRLFRQLFTGDFASHPAIETLRAREVRVDGDDLFGMADGEELGRVPFACHAVPDALTIFSPAP